MLPVLEVCGLWTEVHIQDSEWETGFLECQRAGNRVANQGPPDLVWLCPASMVQEAGAPDGFGYSLKEKHIG
jgi:hypothetical protein